MRSANDIVIIFGPTCSGKSALALQIAQYTDSIIINVDSMQVYKEIACLTNSPTAYQKSLANHFLYNYTSIFTDYSANTYVQDASQVINHAKKNKKTIVIVGGSGFYIDSLLHGLDDMPVISDSVTHQVDLEYKQKGLQGLYSTLLKVDKKYTSEKLIATDKYRILRAYQVFLQTGNPISYYFSKENINLTRSSLFNSYKIVCLYPDRQKLYQECNTRCETLFKTGIAEVEAIICNPDFEKISTKAIGLKEIKGYIQGDYSYLDSIQGMQKRTRNYAKRQFTWMKKYLNITARCVTVFDVCSIDIAGFCRSIFTRA